MRGLGFLIGLLSLSLGCIGCQQRPTAITTSPTVAPPSSSAIPSPAPLLAQTPAPPNPILNRQLDAFIVGTTASGSLRQNQGVWMQTDTQLLANVQGTVPLSAASLTKVATSLAALQTLGPNYRFVTKVGVVGTINQGILQGDLVVEGGQDPLFVWEDAIALGNLLQQKGIRKIQGNVIVVGPFYMNFETSPIPSGTFLKQGLDA
ncbi:MAG TPA: D-alanyl-D-alanine carboxypeptidase, partial [Stenomitos sp.]